ncbi:ribosomal large subunit pseudouridine synthase D [Myroides guanonis]|uniref:Pseudouridine synthase n=2 Tax=Myroides guanonis TaxID=1150112 RepID=A0A1I3UF29_9FLAO|nr:ribosomal large subunit pseudouridine synthase D [Myroides guanonis]
MSFNEDIEEGLFEHFRFEAGKGQAPLRVDKFLMNLIENATRNKIQQAASNGNIFVNEIPVKSNHKVKASDIVRVLMEEPPFENKIIPENIPLNIVYEDDTLLVINKEPGLVVHPGHGNYTGTLVNALAYHFENLPLNSSERPGLVHRIDKDTSGLLVVAKTEWAMAELQRQFAEKTTEREYVALVWGNVVEEEGIIESYIGRHVKNRMQMATYDDETKGKWAVTHYKVLERLGYVTLVSCRLETGRTHQIRVHMKSIGHTLFNDERYGGNLILKGTTFTKYKQFVDNCFQMLPRQALHAKTLGFEHPTTKEFMRFNSEIPADLQQTIDKWRSYATASHIELE